ncbi:MAG: hypothetical protein ACE361_16800 [Aureliella sp.]
MRNMLLALGLVVAFTATADQANAQGPLGGLLRHGMSTKGDVWAQSHAAGRPWHGQYYYLPSGQPTALVVPPTAIMQSNYSWGVSMNTMTPTYHQYGPAAMSSAGGAFYATPIWPSHTNQFGIYPVRAPW